MKSSNYVHFINKLTSWYVRVLNSLKHVRLLLCILTICSVQQHSFSQCQTLIWSDEFNDVSLNLTDWNYQTGDPNVNNELEYYTSRTENIKLEDGKLKIISRKENYNGSEYTSAKITSSGKHSFLYGRIEANIKLPKTQGLWPAFWMMSQNSAYGSWPASGEIDIMESLGSNVFKDFGTIHYGSDEPNHKSSGGTYNLTEDLSEDFHVYAVEWKKDTIRWYLDDVNFYSITKMEVAPEFWPFDKEFYIIFNVAVGGWFGGNPDATTIFPQTMEVDYVRVYSNPQTLSITGKANVLSGDISGYKITNGTGSSYKWNVPEDAIILNGQGTDSITVKWGNTNNMTVDVDKGTCGVFSLSKKVIVTPNSCDILLDDFESNRIVTYTSSTGSFNPGVANPGLNNVNASSQVASYVRNPGNQYDILYYSVGIVSNSIDYETGKKVLFMDVYTTAPIGTVINWQFENKARVTKPHPSGRRAIFVGITTVKNQWERIKFSYNSTPDAGTLPTSIDQFTFLVKPDSYTNDKYYFDNMVVRNVEDCGLPATSILNALEHHFKVNPNPANDKITFSLESPSAEPLNIIITDILGKEIMRKTFLNISADMQVSLDVKDLYPGIYIFSAQQGNSTYSSKIIIE